MNGENKIGISVGAKVLKTSRSCKYTNHSKLLHKYLKQRQEKCGGASLRTIDNISLYINSVE
jgi:hypothetical protein